MSAATPLVVHGDDETAALELQGHRVEVRSIRSPDKTTPNEDAALVMPVGSRGLVLAVADGVGGTAAGGEAALLVIEMLASALAAVEDGNESLRTVILDTIETANQTLLDSGRRGATTLVVVEIVDRELRSYHVGDSELIVTGQRGAIKARIIPHSPTGFAVEAGLLGEDEAVKHEQRHILFNAVGAADMRVDVSAPVRLAQFDTVLLASDGLVDNLYVDEIVHEIRAGRLALSVDSLMKSARDRMFRAGGSKPSKPDDLTVIACRALRQRRRKRREPPASGTA